MSLRSLSRHVRALARAASIAAAGLALVVLTGPPGASQVAGEWPQFQGDAAHSGTADGPEPPYSPAWHAQVDPGGPLGTQGISAPVVAGGVVVAVGPEDVLAFDLGSGAPAWSVPRELGPPAQPAVATVAGRSVVLYTEGWAGHPPERGADVADGATGATSPSPDPEEEPAAGAVDSRLVAIDLETQEPVWDPVELAEATRSGVTVDGNRAYVVDVDGEVTAVDLDAGSVVWTSSVERPVTTPVAVVGDRLVVAARGVADAPGARVVALETDDGAEAWRRDVASPGILVATAPAVGDDLAVVSFSDRTVRAFEIASGREAWTTALGTTPTPFDAAVAIADGAAFVTDFTRATGSAYRLDLATGEVEWDFALNEPMFRGAPVVIGGVVLVGTTDGSLNALDAATGERLWRGRRPGSIRSLAPVGSILIAVRSGENAGLDAFARDPDGGLAREASPTTVDPLRLLGNFLVAAAIVVAAALGGGWALTRRAPIREPDEEVEAT